MTKTHEETLRALADRAHEVANSIQQRGRRADSMQSEVRDELHTQVPDKQLENVELALHALIKAIDGYLNPRPR
jgi:hypothetical protein